MGNNDSVWTQGTVDTRRIDPLLPWGGCQLRCRGRRCFIHWRDASQRSRDFSVTASDERQKTGRRATPGDEPRGDAEDIELKDDEQGCRQGRDRRGRPGRCVLPTHGQNQHGNLPRKL